MSEMQGEGEPQAWPDGEESGQEYAAPGRGASELPEADAYVDEIAKGDDSSLPDASEFVDQIDRGEGVPDATVLLDEIDLTRPATDDTIATSSRQAEGDDDYETT